MAKISISNLQSGYASTSALNASFDTIEQEFQNKVLYRDNPTGEPNQMENDIDLNSNDLLNAGTVNATNLLVNGVDYVATMQGIYNNYTSITQKVTISTASPSGGSNGDIWFKIT